MATRPLRLTGMDLVSTNDLEATSTVRSLESVKRDELETNGLGKISQK